MITLTDQAINIPGKLLMKQNSGTAESKKLSHLNFLVVSGKHHFAEIKMLILRIFCGFWLYFAENKVQ